MEEKEANYPTWLLNAIVFSTKFMSDQEINNMAKTASISATPSVAMEKSLPQMLTEGTIHVGPWQRRLDRLPLSNRVFGED